jgi:two-component system, LytTR family, response regulator
MMRALIVDDEPLARAELRALLLETGAFELVGEGCANAIEALPVLRAERPDVLFLDVQMPVVDGFELLAMLDDETLPRVVFVTAHDAFALRAFDANAADYLLKPVSRERLARTVERLRQAHVQVPAGEPRSALASNPLTRVPCLAGKAIKLLPVADVEFVRSGPAGVWVVSATGEFLTELTLKVLEDRTGLLRCHKQFLVNVERVDEVSMEDAAGAVLRTRGGHEVPVSRRYFAILREKLGI